MDLQDAVGQDRNHVATAHLIMDQVDRGLDNALRAIGDHHRLQAARVIRVELQDLGGIQLASDKILRYVDFW